MGNLVSRIRPTNAHEHVVAGCEMCANVSFSLASVLGADDDVDAPLHTEREKAETGGRACEQGRRIGVMRFEDAIGD